MSKRLRKKDLLKVCFKDLNNDESLPTLADSYYLIMYLSDKHDVINTDINALKLLLRIPDTLVSGKSLEPTYLFNEDIRNIKKT